MFRSFAIVPAAGVSARMGAPKLLMPFGGRAMIDWVLTSWTASRVTRTVVVVRPGDEALLGHCREFDLDVVVPTCAPADMKASVVAAIAHIEAAYAPAAFDAWLLAPADMPRLAARAIDAVLGAYDAANPMPVAPAFMSRRGHPLLMPWKVAAQVAHLQPHEGVNALAARTAVREVAWTDATILHDLDTPDDFARLEREELCPAAFD